MIFPKMINQENKLILASDKPKGGLAYLEKSKDKMGLSTENHLCIVEILVKFN